MGYTILITGASGFIGSTLCADLSKSHYIVGLYRRAPSENLKKAAPKVKWIKGEVADADCIDWIFKQNASNNHPIDYVIHFAAFTGFGDKWEDEYSNTNIIGTRNIIQASCENGVKRILFAGSIAALPPPGPGKVLTEMSVAEGSVAYARSKALGEKLFYRYSDKVRVVILRLGGVFTDWCELPPLYSLITMWSRPISGRLMPGLGRSGFPYIHRKDVVRIVRRIIEKDHELLRFETLFASCPGFTCQKELFPIVRKNTGSNFSLTPIHVSRFMARMALHVKYGVNLLLKRKTYERAWMIDYVDRPIVVNTDYTVNKLAWQPDPNLHILEKLPLLIKNYNAHPKEWMRRNINRNDQRYEYYPD